MKKYLTKSKIAVLIDDEDYDLVNSKKWYVRKTNKTKFGEYYQVVTGKSETLSRFIMKCPKNLFVDHINRDTLDNRKENLRLCSCAENTRNTPKEIGNFSSVYKGVCKKLRDGKFIAQIQVDKRVFHLGSFDSEIEAAACYDNYAKIFFGEFAHLNNVENDSWCREAI